MNKRVFQPKLRFEQLLLIRAMLPLVILGVLIIVFQLFAFRSVIKDLILSRNQSAANLAGEVVTQDISNYLLPLQTTTTYLADLTGDTAAQSAKLQEFAPFLSEYEGGVTLLDVNGQAVASTPNSINRVGLDYSFRSYFDTARETLKTAYSTVITEKPSGELSVVIANPIIHNDKFSGVLIGVLFLKHHIWESDFGNDQNGILSKAYIVDSSGTIIFHPKSEMIGQSILNQPDLMNLLTTNQSQSILFTPSGSSQEMVASYSPLEIAQWGIMIVEPFSTLLSPADPYYYLIAIASLAILLVIAIILINGLRSLMAPLFMLMGESQRITNTSSFTPLPESGPEETRQLIHQFNDMVVRINEQQKNLRAYAVQILQSQEEERRRISRDLHDETVQDLVGLSQRVELCKTWMARDPIAARQRLDELHALTNQALVDVRRLSNNLRPVVLEDLGLTIAVQRLCDQIAQDIPTAQVNFKLTGIQRRLSSENELITYRIIQEALNNIRKHARTTPSIDVSLTFYTDKIEAAVCDCGPGFEAKEISEWMEQGHLGLAGMVERASLFGGEVKVLTNPQQGTQIHLSLPDQAVPN